MDGAALIVLNFPGDTSDEVDAMLSLIDRGVFPLGGSGMDRVFAG